MIKNLVRKIRLKLVYNSDIRESIRKYYEIENIIYGYNEDENIYDKYQKIVKVVAHEKMEKSR